MGVRLQLSFFIQRFFFSWSGWVICKNNLIFGKHKDSLGGPCHRHQLEGHARLTETQKAKPL
jgi:hypothetical protein